MGFRFRRSFRVFPGLRLNLSKSGVSTSIDGRGAWFTVGPRGTRTTVGLPGSTKLRRAAQQPRRRGQGILLLLVVVAVVAFVFGP